MLILAPPHFLWYGPFFPALAEHFVQWEQKGSLAVLDQVGWNPVSAWGFPRGQAVNGLAEFLYGGFSIELYHDRRALDGIKGCGRHKILPGVEVGIVSHPSLHLLSLICNNFANGGFEGSRLVLQWSHCRLDAIVHPSDVPCNYC